MNDSPVGHQSRPRVLQIASSDLTVAKLLLPLIDELNAKGYSVDAACADGRFARDLAGQGYVVHILPMSRKLSPWRNIRSVWALYRLIRREKYHIVHVHTPIAAIAGRLAAWLAGAPVTIYTAHGFYFHERMGRWLRRLHIGAERLLGLFTDMLFTQSAEDAQAAVREHIARPERVVWISNGVDIERFRPGPASEELRQQLGISSDERVVGFVGRLDREKGLLDLIEATRLTSERVDRLVLLIVGDSSSAGDRDPHLGSLLRELTEAHAAPFRIVFTGWTDGVEVVMRLLDLFVLPSHREGMPRSIIEAMASGKPVVATDIRGCREEVMHGHTGFLVPVADPEALAAAMTEVLDSQELADSMGRNGRARALQYFDERDVVAKQLGVYSRLVHERLPAVYTAGISKTAAGDRQSGFSEASVTARQKDAAG